MVLKTNVMAALLAALGGGFLLAGPANPPAAAELKIGFVNIFKVRNASQAQQAVMKRFEEEIGREQKAIQDRQDTLKKQLREELPLFEKGSPEFEKLRLDLQLKEHRIKLEKQALLAKLERESLKILEGFLQRLQEAVDGHARKNGYTAIFLHRPVAEVKGKDDLIAVNNQWVLYRDEALDLTDEIIKILNAK